MWSVQSAMSPGYAGSRTETRGRHDPDLYSDRGPRRGGHRATRRRHGGAGLPGRRAGGNAARSRPHRSRGRQPGDRPHRSSRPSQSGDPRSRRDRRLDRGDRADGLRDRRRGDADLPRRRSQRGGRVDRRHQPPRRRRGSRALRAVARRPFRLPHPRQQRERQSPRRAGGLCHGTAGIRRLVPAAGRAR